MRSFFFATLTLAIGTSWMGCGRGEKRRVDDPPAVASPVVAMVADVPVHAAQVRAQMRALGVDAGRALNDLITFELLARAAAETRPQRESDPEEAWALDAAKVARLIEREVEPQLGIDAIPEGEVRALYERGLSHFVHGRLVEIAVLCVFTGARMKPEARARASDNAQRLRLAVAAAPERTAAAFAELAQDPAWVERRVSFTTVLQAADTPFPAVVGRAAQALRKPGDTTDLVGDETGYYIARYVSERPPENVSFAEAAPALRRDMYQPWRRQRFLQLSLELAHGHAIDVFPENLPLLAADNPGSPPPRPPPH